MTDQPTFTAEEFRQAQSDLGLSDVQLANMLGFDSSQTIRRFKASPESNSNMVVRPGTARLLRAYLDGYRPADWPATPARRQQTA